MQVPLRMLFLTLVSLALCGATISLPSEKFQNYDHHPLGEVQGQVKPAEHAAVMPIIPDERTKRDVSLDSRPYSAYRGRTFMNRYRYPVQKKKFYNSPESYEIGEDMLEEETLPQEYLSSLFRERQYNTPAAAPSYSKRSRGYNLALTPYDLQTMGRMYQLGKRSQLYDYLTSSPSASSPYVFDGSHMQPYSVPPASQLSNLREEELREIIEYLMSKNNVPDYTTPAIRRRKRSTDSETLRQSIKNNTLARAKQNNKHHITDKQQNKLTKSVPVSQLDSERTKRGFGDYFSWGVPDSTQTTSANDEELNDFLTREYFKTIARSVGNKKKRMAFGKFEAEKRSNNYSRLFENLLQASSGPYYQDPQTARKLRSIVQQVMNQVARSKIRDQGHEKKKRKAVLDDAVLPYVAEALKLPEECPVLDHLMENCGVVSEAVGDDDKAFLNACLRHEVCYMCGSSVGVSGHECNALLSSALEVSCMSSALECLSAAGETYNILSKSSRYDNEGTCTYDPCVRELLENP